MDFEAFFFIGKIGAAFASIIGAIKYLPKGYKWARSWTIIKRRELERLKNVETEHQKCGAKDTGDVPMSPPPIKPKEYRWRGFLWLLRQPFWENYDGLAVDQLSDTFLGTAIHGPYCVNCKRDLSRAVTEKRSVCACSKEFSEKEFGTLRYPVLSLKRSVYSEAQAAVRRNELWQE